MNIHMRVLLLLLPFFMLVSITASGQEFELEKDLNGKWGFVDSSGNWVVEPQYDWALYFSEGLASVKSVDKWGFIDKLGVEVVESRYDFAWSFSEGLAAVQINDKWGFIDKLGNVVVNAQYDGVDSDGFVEGVAIVEQNGKWGFVNKSNEWVIKPQYDWCGSFSDGLAVVKLGGKYGFIDISNVAIIPIIRPSLESIYFAKDMAVVQVSKKFLAGEYDEINEKITNANNLSSFSSFAQNYVQQSVNEWQKKGEFEKSLEWQQRVREESRNRQVAILTKDAERKYIELRGEVISKNGLDFTLGEYDADSEVFLLENRLWGRLLVSVPIDNAENFKLNWKKYKVEPKYIVNNDQLYMVELCFISNINPEVRFMYSNSESINYATTNVTYNFNPIELNLLAVGVESKVDAVQNITSKKISIGKSDVDVSIPVTNIVNKNTFAVIISNENYTKVSPVKMALNDGYVFKEYCHKTMGIPESNIRFYKDATYGDMIGAVEDIEQISEAYNGEVDIIFYYSGHGFPDEYSHDSYLLPVDGSSSQTEISYSLSRLYSELNLAKVQHVTMFFDACFSGSQRDGSMLTQARGIVLKPKMAVPSDNMVVFTAASGEQTAYNYGAKNHGLFTYFLLKKLKESRGVVTLKELGNYIITNVKQNSIVKNKKLQTPTVSSASERYLIPINNDIY